MIRLTMIQSPSRILLAFGASDMSGKSVQQLEAWLRRQGFKPVSSKTKEDLKKADCWGMPEE